MFKIAILGSENSHAANFAAMIAGRDGKRLFPDVELLGVYSDQSIAGAKEGNEQVAKVSTCNYFADSYQKFLGKVDGVMVTARHGKYHLEYAREFIKQGIPAWIDKPICASTDDVLELVQLSKQYHTPICGGSSLVHTDGVIQLSEYVKQQKGQILGGHVTAPVNLVNDYGNFWFYSQHLVQMITKIFGCNVKGVSAQKNESSVRSEYYYENFVVTAFFGTGYSACVYNDGYNAECVNINLVPDNCVP